MAFSPARLTDLIRCTLPVRHTGKVFGYRKGKPVRDNIHLLNESRGSISLAFTAAKPQWWKRFGATSETRAFWRVSSGG